MLKFDWNSLRKGDRVLGATEGLGEKAEAATTERRCWRCLQMFACEPSELHSGAPEWWLCATCHEKLLPASSHRLKS
jgi:hypothetical protein